MSKETLAKLMAIEDINVENRKVPTAAFDLKSRTLILPIWKDDLSEHVTDLLVGHEDSALDLTVYSSMLVEIDRMIKIRDKRHNLPA